MRIYRIDFDIENFSQKDLLKYNEVLGRYFQANIDDFFRFSRLFYEPDKEMGWMFINTEMPPVMPSNLILGDSMELSNFYVHDVTDDLMRHVSGNTRILVYSPIIFPRSLGKVTLDNLGTAMQKLVNDVVEGVTIQLDESYIRRRPNRIFKKFELADKGWMSGAVVPFIATGDIDQIKELILRGIGELPEWGFGYIAAYENQ